jgi:hypothetical protein
MEAKEKAMELIEKYRCINYDVDDIGSHKEGALIAVDEIITLIAELPDNNIAFYKGVAVMTILDIEYHFWNEVKQEINKL